MKSYQKNKKLPQNGRGDGHVTYLNSQSPYNISRKATARDFKFCYGSSPGGGITNLKLVP